MTTKIISCYVLINSSLIGGKIFINCEGSSDWAILGDLVDHVGFTGSVVDSLTIPFIVIESGLVLRDALSITLRSLITFSWWAWLSVLGSTLEWVWLAGLLVSKKITSDNTVSLPVSVSHAWETSLASTTASLAAGKNVGWGDSWLRFSLREDADSVAHSFNRGESPAGSA